MLTRPLLALALVAAATSTLWAEPAAEAFLAPSMDLGGTLDLPGLLAEFPSAAESPEVERALARLSRWGLPDPRTHLGRLTLGWDFGGPEGVRSSQALAETKSSFLPHVERAAGELGIPLAESAHRGHRILSATWRKVPARFAEAHPELGLASFGPTSEVDTQGTLEAVKSPPVSIRFPALEPGDFLRLTSTLDPETKADLAEGKLSHLGHLNGISIRIQRLEDQTYRAQIVLTATGSIKARFVKMAVASQVGGLPEKVSDPVAKKVLAGATTERDGADVLVTLLASRPEMESILATLLELIPAEPRL